MGWKELLLGIIFVAGLPVFALKTAYLSFDHPDGWRCELVQGIWICQSSVDTERRESVILSIATLATEWDTIDNYLDYLKQPRVIRDEEDKEIVSEVSYTRKRNINGLVWVDSLQKNSELPGFWTRYLATVHSTPRAQLAVLVTYLVSDEKYKAFAPQFERMVTTLKPNAEFDLNIPSQQGDGPIPGSTRLGPNTRDLIADRLGVKKGGISAPRPEQKPEENGNSGLLLGVLLLCVAGFIFYRIRKRRQAASQRPSEPKMPSASAK